MTTKSAAADRHDRKSLATQAGKPRRGFKATNHSFEDGSPVTSMTENMEQRLIKVLVCDDNPTDRELVCTCLQQTADRDIVVLETWHTKEIQDALRKRRIDLLIVDSQMPGKPGTEWLAEVAKRQLAPIVMLVGSGTKEVATQPLREQALGYLPKANLSLDKLSSTINVALDKWIRLQQAKADKVKLERLITCDPLTGLPNRQAILAKLCELVNLANRYRGDFSLILMDVDHFRKVNDRYGYFTGDEVLEKTADLIRSNIRNTDIAGRYGGEEFVIVLPNTNFSSSWVAAERLRTTIEKAEFKDSARDVFSVTVSQGLVGWERNDDADSLISRAVEALRMAREKGRNRVQILLGPTLRDKV